MRIRLTDIPDEGLHLSEDVDAAQLLKAIPEGLPEGYEAREKLNLDLELKRNNRQVRIKGKVKTQVDFTCSRCGASGSWPLRLAIHETFLPMESFQVPEKKRVDLEEDDLDNAYYENGEIDLGRYLAEEMMLALPMAPRCQDAHCAEQPNDYTEAWGDEDEPEKAVNPMWQESLKRIRLKKKK